MFAVAFIVDDVSFIHFVPFGVYPFGHEYVVFLFAVAFIVDDVSFIHFVPFGVYPFGHVYVVFVLAVAFFVLVVFLLHFVPFSVYPLGHKYVVFTSFFASMTSTKVPVFSVTSFVSTFLYSVLVIVSLDHCDHSPKSPHLPSVIFSYSY